MEFWNDPITDRSHELLMKLRKSFDFVLIGGWAAYLYTGAIKSKDIDIIVDFEVLASLKNDEIVKKNHHLKKYEISRMGISIDIYVPYYSELGVPVEKIMENCMSVEGFKVPKIEVLLALKQRAELDRRDSIKGVKDRVDILSLVLKGNVDWKRYAALLRELGMEDYLSGLKSLVAGLTADEFGYLGIEDPRKMKLRKKEIGDILSRLR